MACSLILSLYIRSELTYDQHNLSAESIYRVTVDFTTPTGTELFALNSPALGPLILAGHPQIGEFVRFKGSIRSVVKYKETQLYWDDVMYADENVFDVFTHKAIYGDLKSALADPSSIAISENFSKQYFGDQNPVGKVLKTDSMDFTVSAVFADLPENSHLKYSALISMNLLKIAGNALNPARLFNISGTTYFRLAEGVNRTEFQSILDDFYNSKAKKVGDNQGVQGKYHIQALSEIHFDKRWKYDSPTGNITYVYGFIAVTAFILLIACINYINLAMAKATKRAREIGIRKVVGAGRQEIVAQFVIEAIIYAVIALILSIVVVELIELLTPLNHLLGKITVLNFVGQSVAYGWILLGILSVVLLSGLYPALHFSSIPPLSAINQLNNVKRFRMPLSTVMIAFQIFVSITVLTCTVLLQNQMNFITEQSLGFDHKNKMSIVLRGVDLIEKFEIIKGKLLENGNIHGASLSTFVAGQNVATNVWELENNTGEMESISLNQFVVDKDFIDVMGIEITKGNDFISSNLEDTESSIIVNEALVKKMGWKKPIGKRIEYFGRSDIKVIGVMKDFHYRPLHETIAPLFIALPRKDMFSYIPQESRTLFLMWIMISISEDKVPETIEYVASVMMDFDAEHPFEFDFVDDLLAENYQNEANLIALNSIFSALCIAISCMGLYGMSALTTEQRTKEIGIRKVLGASTFQIILMLLKRLFWIVIPTALLASIVSYLIMNRILDTYAYRANIEVWIFVSVSVTVGVIAFLTVVVQVIRTARSNPIHSLRYE